MCGITGLIGVGNSDILKRMTDAIAHRGPDDWGMQWFPNFNSGLGHRRLSIIDLSPAGHQPMTNDDGTLWITFNGEIYNYQEIRKELCNLGFAFKSNSDTEVILRAYQTWGVEFLDKLNGMFAFAILNSQTGELFVARDRIGIKPLYYTNPNGQFIFASEIKAILESGLIEREPDYAALHTPARFQISPLTGFKNIYKLPPGHYLIFKNSELTLQKYWEIEPTENTMSETEATNQLEGLLLDAIHFQMIADVEVGAFLSGGLDSSLITVLMSKEISKQIKTYTIKFTDEDQKFERMVDDSYYAKKVAERYGFEHYEFEIQTDMLDLLPKMVWHLDEPLTDTAAINTYLISKAARESGIIVLLNGMGGDEIFGGYRKHLACLRADVYQELPRVVQKSISALFEHLPVASDRGGFRWIRWAKRFLTFASLPSMERFLSSDYSMNSDQYQKIFANESLYWDSLFFNSQASNFNNNGLSYLTQMCLNDTQVFLPEHNLTYCDKAAMAAGVESRPPLTDHNLVEFMFRLPPKFRINGKTQKYLLKKVAEKHLPKEIINREKGGFAAPLRSWVRISLREMVDDYLSIDSLRKRGLYNPEFVRQKILLDREGKEDNAYLIWQLLTTELWFRTFFE
jgi:asparagine synthase (glutamine-hydrolysing)